MPGQGGGGGGGPVGGEGQGRPPRRERVPDQRSEMRRRMSAALVAKQERQVAHEAQAVARAVNRHVNRVQVPRVADVAVLPEGVIRRRKEQAQAQANRLKDAALERWAAAEAIEAKLAELDAPKG